VEELLVLLLPEEPEPEPEPLELPDPDPLDFSAAGFEAGVSDFSEPDDFSALPDFSDDFSPFDAVLLEVSAERESLR
jgi:hypothetical protein